jgi:transcriptional regulator of heat shock response
MNQRQQKILSVVIEEYTNTAVPVGSDVLVKKYNLKVSSATIRNDMNKLEEEGLLYQPHVSAGRIPTDKGYRYFVEEIMKDKELSRDDQQKLQREMLKLKAQNKRLTKTTAKLLSVLSGNLAVSGIPMKDEFAEFGMRDLLDQPEFQQLDEVCRLAEVMDAIDINVDKLVKGLKIGETRIFIGKENPVADMPDCAMMVSPYKLKSGEKGILALIGPKRMRYAKNKSLLNYMKKILGSSAVIILVFSI